MEIILHLPAQLHHQAAPVARAAAVLPVIDSSGEMNVPNWFRI